MTGALLHDREAFPSEDVQEATRATIQAKEIPRRALPGLLPSGELAASRSSPKVLYIEDNAENMLLVKRVMRMRPAIQLLEVGAGIPGLALAREHVPDIVVLDLNLPDINGDEVLRQLWQTREPRPSR